MGNIPAPAKKISWETFEKKYLTREDKYKYEWVNGTVEKTERTMNQNQLFIWSNLRNLFDSLRQSKKVTGEFVCEIDAFFSETIHRRPDMAWYAPEQQVIMAEGGNQVPPFVIEVISKNDNINQVNKKLKNYQDAGVKVVWLIFPELKEVQVYHHLASVTYRGKDKISAAPVLPAFAMTVEEIFQKPTKTG
ncbi:MAG: Uma2 family endonuclease [Lewinellaceae bacterium]|nr:Uma2 family endonuclease [Saprospiraceae bacterium]MCB9337170.1 Uma2 family endonuclease [Lewinellaceae bacterium]